MEQTTLSITGAGQLGDLSQWSVNAQATPVHPGASAAGAGSFSATVGADPEFDSAIAEEYTLADQTAGFLNGNLTNVSRSGASVQITGDTALSKLAVDRTMPPGGTVPGEILSEYPQMYPGFTYGRAATSPISGDVYVKTGNGQYVFRYSEDGEFLGFWGSTGTGNSQFSSVGWNASGIAVADNGNVYVCDYGNFRVQWFSPTGNYLGQFSTGTRAPDLIQIWKNQLYIVTAAAPGSGYFEHAQVSRANLDGSGLTTFVGYSGLGLVPEELTEKRFYSYLAFTETHLYIYSTGFRYWNRVRLDNGAVETVRSLEIVGSLGRGYVQLDSSTLLVRSMTPNPGLVFGRGASIVKMDNPLLRAEQMPLVVEETAPVTDVNLPVTREGTVLNIVSNTVQAKATGLSAYRLSKLIQNYVNKTVSGITVDYQATNDPYVSAVGWKDSVWTKLNQLCVAYGIEMSISGGVIVVRDVGSVDLELEDTTERNLTINNTQTAQYVTIPYNNARTGADEVYDAAKDNNRTIEAAAWTETIEYIQTPHSPITLVQPQATTTLPVPRNSFYVIASDNVRVMPAQFAQYGGRVEVSVDSTQVGTIRVRFQAPGEIPGVPGPYRLAVSDGTNTYGGLRIDGTGVFVRNEEERIFTGAAPDISTTEDAGSALANPFIATRAQAYSRGSFATRRLAGPNLSLSLTISNKDALGFGLTEGALFRYRDNRWRIVTITTSRAGVQITAEPYVVVGDVEALWSSVADFQGFWDGKKVKDGNVRPLAS